MDNLLLDGDMVWLPQGDVQTVTGLQELIQRALIRLTVKRGSFVYDQTLGSRLAQMPMEQIEDSVLEAYVQEALEGLDGVECTGLEKKLDAKAQMLSLTVYLRMQKQDAIVELHRKTSW